MINYMDITYLKSGSKKQKNVYKVLKNLDIFNVLKQFNPILVGTIPLGIDTDKSDLDIICYVHDLIEFKKLVVDSFSSNKGFKVSNKRDKIVIRFEVEGFLIEIYTENKPTDIQNGYRHMLIEKRILDLGGSILRQKVIDLKNKSFKTEPIFAGLLGLYGNPYEELLSLEDMSDEYIVKLFSSKGITRRDNTYSNKLILATAILSVISFVIFIGDALFNDLEYFGVDVFLHLPYLILGALLLFFYRRGKTKVLSASLILLFLINITWVMSITALILEKISSGNMSTISFMQYVETILIIGIFVLLVIVFIKRRKTLRKK